MRLSGYINSPIEPGFLSLRHGMGYLMHHSNEPIAYSRNENYKLNDIPHQCFFKEGSTEIKKTRNTPTLFTQFLMQITYEIFPTGALSLQHLYSLMVPSLDGAPRNNIKHPESSPIKKQDQCTQACYIKTGLKHLIYQLVNPYDLHQSYIITTRKQ